MFKIEINMIKVMKHLKLPIEELPEELENEDDIYVSQLETPAIQNTSSEEWDSDEEANDEISD